MNNLIFIKKYQILAFVFLLFFFNTDAQLGSYGNAFVYESEEMVLHLDNHNFLNGGGGVIPGIIGTKRSFPSGYISYMSGTTWSNASSSAYVDGYVKWYGTGSFIFPIGDNNIFQPAGISSSSMSNPTVAAYYHTDPSIAVTSNLLGGNEPILPASGPFATTSLGIGVEQVSSKEYWDINGTVASTITLTWSSISDIATLTGNDLTKLSIVGWDGSRWQSIASAVDGLSLLTGFPSTLTEGSITTHSFLTPNLYEVYTLAVINPCTPDVTFPTFNVQYINCTDEVPTTTNLTELEFENIGNANGNIGDNPCGNIIISATNSNTLVSCNDTIFRTYTVLEYFDMNGNGNWDFATDSLLFLDSTVQKFVFRDTISPVFSNCPVDLVLNAGIGTCNAIGNWTVPIANDNCSSSLTVTGNFSSGSSFPVGDNDIVYIATDECGNKDTCTFKVTVNDIEPPQISIAGVVSSYCEGSVVNWTETISDNCGIFSIVSSHHTGSTFPIGTTTVIYTVTDIHGNIAVDSFDVIVTPLPLVNLSSLASEQTICIKNSVDLTVSNVSPNSIYNWYLNGVLVKTGESFNVSFNEKVQGEVVTVVEQNTLGCSSLPDTVIINTIICDIVIPEIFSPNGDGKNDLFVINGIESLFNTRLLIYNRWGSLVYENDDYKNNWNGISNSTLNVGDGELPEGTYYYILQLEDNEEIFKGYVYLKK